MSIYRKLLFVAFTAALLLSAMVTAASASYSVSNRNLRSTWSSLEFNTGVGTVRCPVTLEGSIHNTTIPKIVGALLGYITHATARSSNCSGGTLTVEQEVLPWHIRYLGFSGMLPRITLLIVQLVGLKVRLSIAGINCTTQTEASQPLVIAFKVETGLGQLEPWVPDANTAIPLRRNFLCELAGNYTASGAGKVRVLGSSTMLMFIRLI